jgi:ribonuclease VapC
MILDSSVVAAVLRQEPEALALSRAIKSSQPYHIPAASYLEAAIIIDRSDDPIASRLFDEFFRSSRTSIEAAIAKQAQIARQAYRDFGRGRHKAGLNFGDCFAYALAKEMDEPLLFFQRSGVQTHRHRSVKF